MSQYNVQFQDGNGSLAGFRNLLINGLFSVNQRGYVSSTNTTAANQFTVDRWFVNTSGQNLLLATSQNSTTATAPAGGLSQCIEGNSIQTGTYTLSWVGTATAQVNGSAVLNGGIVTLTGGANAVVKFSGGTVTKPQLEPGPVATPFEQRFYGIELELCQRYYQVLSFATSYMYDGTTTAAYQKRIWYSARSTPMRVAPTQAFEAVFGCLGSAVALTGYTDHWYFEVSDPTQNPSGNVIYLQGFSADAELTS